MELLNSAANSIFKSGGRQPRRLWQFAVAWSRNTGRQSDKKRRENGRAMIHAMPYRGLLKMSLVVRVPVTSIWVSALVFAKVIDPLPFREQDKHV
jgi:hypothetical protein